MVGQGMLGYARSHTKVDRSRAREKIGEAYWANSERKKKNGPKPILFIKILSIF
jgi:hypothetical protein